MVMTVVIFTHQFKPSRAVAEIKPLHHAHFLQQVHRPVNRGQIAPASGQGREYFLVGERMRMPPQNPQNRLARTGDFAGVSPQTTGQRGQFLPSRRMGMGMRFHDA
jgi:hypothetical protein